MHFSAWEKGRTEVSFESLTAQRDDLPSSLHVLWTDNSQGVEHAVLPFAGATMKFCEHCDKERSFANTQ